MPMKCLNPNALKQAKIVYDFGLSECNWVNTVVDSSVLYVTHYW